MISKEMIERAESAESALSNALTAVDRLYEMSAEAEDGRSSVLGDIRSDLMRSHVRLVEAYS